MSRFIVMKSRQRKRRTSRKRQSRGSRSRRLGIRQRFVTWYAGVEDSVKDTFPFLTDQAFSDEVETILNDPSGWPRQGYTFIRVPVGTPGAYPVNLATGQTIKRTCHIDGLSCAAMDKKWIRIHVDRWLTGSPFSELSVPEYRRYVINHEMGHLLGRLHKPWPRHSSRPCYVMNQQTLAAGRCRGNPVPLDGE